jgi:hypothetical protein
MIAKCLVQRPSAHSVNPGPSFSTVTTYIHSISRHIVQSTSSRSRYFCQSETSQSPFYTKPPIQIPPSFNETTKLTCRTYSAPNPMTSYNPDHRISPHAKNETGKSERDPDQAKTDPNVIYQHDSPSKSWFGLWMA